MRKLIKIVIIIITLILLIYSYIRIIKNDSIKKFLGISILKITSGSMEPELNVGEIIIIKECNEYKIGDIITYKVDEKFLVTHRIIEIYENQITTKGDYNNTVDKPVLLKDIQGKVIFHSKLLGIIYRYRMMIILILFILIILV